MPFSIPERSQQGEKRAAAAPQADAAAPEVRLVRRRPARVLRPSQVPVRSPREVLHGSGQPLATPLREEMEDRFGADFSTVRVHADGAARASAAELGARAYTAGEHVAVGDGNTDKQTLAHELTHVLQQRGGAIVGGAVVGTGHSAAFKVSHPRDAQERAAEENAARVMRAAPSAPSRATAGIGALASIAPRWPHAAGSASVVQRMLDESFTKPDALKSKEGRLCHEFAQKVSDFVDEAYIDLMSGQVSTWEGDKIATFLRLLLSQHDMALVWAGNAIEERVYALMKKQGMTLGWTPQFSESMGGASFPDIVIHLPDSTNDGLVDITSDRGHIDSKAGGWKGPSHIYVAEAYFDSITREQLSVILENLKKGGVDKETAKKMAAAAEAKRTAARKVRETAVAKAWRRASKYTSGAKFIEKEFKGDRKAARQFLLEHGLKKKGVTEVGATKRKKGRKLSEETKKQRMRKVRERRKLLAKPSVEELLKKTSPPASDSESELEESPDELEEEGEEESSEYDE